MWSVYYHSMVMKNLNDSIFGCVRGSEEAHDALRPMELQAALAEIRSVVDDHAEPRRWRVLRKMVAAGFASGRRRRELIEFASSDKIVERVRGVAAEVDALTRDLRVDVATLNRSSPESAVGYLQRTAVNLIQGCVPLDPTCVACYEPYDPARPTTTMTAKVRVERQLSDMAGMMDPRTWSTCNKVFKVSDQGAWNASKNRWESVPSNPPIGDAWSGFLVEEVEVGPVTLGNVLDIDYAPPPSPSNVGDSARTDYWLHESTGLAMPGLSLGECVSVDQGVAEADQIDPDHVQLTVTKKIRFVDLTKGSKKNPYGIDAGEILNIWAPVILCLWLEDVTQVGVCCDP
jgi:hypothetical protein